MLWKGAEVGFCPSLCSLCPTSPSSDISCLGRRGEEGGGDAERGEGGWGRGFGGDSTLCPPSSDFSVVTGEGSRGIGVRDDVDGVGDREEGGGLRGCSTGEGDGDEIEEGLGFESVLRLSALSSISGRCSLAFRRSYNTGEEIFLTDARTVCVWCDRLRIWIVGCALFRLSWLYSFAAAGYGCLLIFTFWKCNQSRELKPYCKPI